MSGHTPHSRKEIRAIAAGFFSDTGHAPDFAVIDDLCRLATGPDSDAATHATAAIFEKIIERLCDSFSTAAVHTCNRVLARLLQFVRQEKGGERLHAKLEALGFAGEKDILDRFARISGPTPIPEETRRELQRIIVLSRVTAGADIAITSVIIHRIARTFPTADIAVIGPSHLGGMFADVPNLQVVPFIYRNDGSLVDKLTSWPQIHDIVNELVHGMDKHQCLLFDPDTRLSQLGLLPLLPEESTCYFPSRMEPEERFGDKDLSFLTNQWLNVLLGENLSEPPFLKFNSEGSGYNAFCRALRDKGCRFCVAINFGVGNDPRKQMPPSFEQELIRRLLDTPDTIVILDTGRGPHEEKRVEAITATLRQNGVATGFFAGYEVREKRFDFSHGLIAFKGSIEELGNLISAADCFIGYDSCGQHIAAATGTPAVIIFAGAPSTRFMRRWAPAVPHSRTIPVTGKDSVDETLRACCAEIDSIRRTGK